MANLLDKAIGYFSPKTGADRAAQRRRIKFIEGKRDYEAAGVGRLSRGRYITSASADAEIGRAGQRLRDRSRDLVRNNPLAAKIVTAHANNFVGFGITPRAKTGDSDKDKILNDLFDEWSKSCISGNNMDFYGAQYLMLRMGVQDGEVYVRRRTRLPSDGLAVPLQLQILDSECCDWGKTVKRESGHTVVQGVEFDLIGNRAGYWMFPENPRGALLAGMHRPSGFVPASDLVQFYEPQTNQVHGVPWLSPCMNEIDELRDYELAENTRKKIESCNVGVVIPGEGDTDDPNVGLTERPVAGGVDEDGEPIDDDVAIRDVYGNPFERMEPGMFAVLHGGKDIKFNTPAISAGIEAYIRTRHRSIAAGARLPYELLTGDFSQANFASGKLGLLEYQRFVAIVQWHYLIPQVLQPIWDWFLAAAKDAGKIPRAWQVKVEWNPPEVESITRLDDAKADLLEVRMGKRSMPEIISRTGRDPRTVLKEIDDWNTDIDKTPSKVVLDTDPRKVTNNGQFQMSASQNGDGDAAAQ